MAETVAASDGSVEAVSSGSLRGGLCLRVAGDGAKGSRILKQRHAAPVHVGKAYVDPAGLYLQMMSPSAGMMDDDQMEVEVEVSAGGSLCLYAPAINKIYASCPGGRGSSSQQRFQVTGKGSFLEWINEGSLLHAGARYRQNTQIQLHGGADMIYYDILWPGRLAGGEAFEFASYQSQIKAMREAQWVALERMSLQAGNGALRSWQRVMGPSLMATIYLFTEKDLSGYVQVIHEQQDATCWLGATPLRGGGLMVRALASSPLRWKRLRQSLRILFAQMLERPFVDMRLL